MQQFLLPARRGAASVAYYVGGTGGDVLVLANGLGGPVSAFRHQIEHFAKRFRIVTWDYRGLYGSRSSARLERVDVAAHADDLERVLDAAGAERAVFVGWSMGVQVVLELLAKVPSRASRLVLMSGAPGRPFSNVRLPSANLWLGPVLDGARARADLVSRAVARLSRWPLAADTIRRLRIVHPRLETAELLGLAREFSSIDFDVYLRTLRALNDHDGTAGLGRIAVPTLVVSGARDLLFSPTVARDLTRRLPRAELYVVERGTHYAPAEFPELVNARIDRFLLETAPPRSHPKRGSGERQAGQDTLTEPNASARLRDVS